MAGDYTRFTHRPERDRSGVLLQQGRVQLDADWNELVEIVNRRARVESVDVIGRCGVPRQTEHGFEIGGSVAGGLTIGIGRCYVDGLLAENRGLGDDWQHEPVWGERVHANPTPYTEQPYLKPAPDPPSGAGPHLVYLDVWEREVGPVDDPELIDSAVGVDTATRLQTAWAVRILEGAGGKGCDPDWEGFPATSSSGARLSAEARGVSEPKDPCHVAPQGGYRGVDNRLYRVEIHEDGSEEGQGPSFKWSRDNASIATRASLVDQLADGRVRLSVDQIGHDRTLRFREDDWVELLDDALEPAGRAGTMARIAPEGVDEQAGELTLASLSGAVPKGPNLRLRRWDQQDDVDPQRGAIPFDPAGQTFELEDGIEVTLEREQPGGFRVGDYWVFAARAGAEKGTVDPLAKEPPRGPRHHYCALAVLKSGVPSDDCRVIYPPKQPPAVVEGGCACDACVTPQSHEEGTLTIQAAVDRVIEAGGGRVCLAVGVYELREPVRISAARSLALCGKGVRTRLVYGGEPAPVLEIADSAEVTVEQLAIATPQIEAEAAALEPLVAIRNSYGTTVQRCFLGLSEREDQGKVSTTGFGLEGAAEAAIGLGGPLPVTVIRENVISAKLGIVASPGPAPGGEDEKDVSAKSPGLSTFGLWIEDNMLLCPRAAIDLGLGVPGKEPELPFLHLGETRIAGNSILGGEEVGVQVGGLVGPDDEVVKSVVRQRKLGEQPQFVTGVPGRLEIVRNQITVTGVGVRVGSERTRIGENEIVGRVTQEPQHRRPPSGIEVRPGAAGGWALRDIEIAGNRVREFDGDGISAACPLESATVGGNTVRNVVKSGIAVRVQGGEPFLSVTENRLLDLGSTGPKSMPAVLVGVEDGRVALAENQCRVSRDNLKGVIEVKPVKAAISVTGNQLSGDPGSPSVRIWTRSEKGALPAQAVLLGNVGDGFYQLDEQIGLPSPWRELNVPN